VEGQFFGLVSDFIHVYLNGALPASRQIGIQAVDRALAQLLRNQFPEVPRQKMPWEEAKAWFKKRYFEGFFLSLLKHEGLHIIAPGNDERGPYLIQIANSEYPWAILYFLICNSYRPSKGWTIFHKEAARFITCEVIPRIFQMEQPEAIPQIPPPLHAQLSAISPQTEKCPPIVALVSPIIPPYLLSTYSNLALHDILQHTLATSLGVSKGYQTVLQQI
jgi:hypothetical protein